jgi:hypothetical protein
MSSRPPDPKEANAIVEDLISSYHMAGLLCKTWDLGVTVYPPLSRIRSAPSNLDRLVFIQQTHE